MTPAFFEAAATALPDFNPNVSSAANPITDKLKIIAIARRTDRNLFTVFVMIITSILFSASNRRLIVKQLLR